MIEKKAYAKINLFLDIESLRSDGYHNIKSIMQTIDWFDTIQVEDTLSKDIKIICNDDRVPLGSTNTVYKVAKAFIDELKSDAGILIRIQKNIPLSAGMAGGSADAAATLKALNALYHFPLSSNQLINIGKKIGADIPFCLIGGTQKVGGIGDVVEECKPMPECFIVCAKMQNSNVSTCQAYKKLDNVYCNFLQYQYNKQAYENIISCLDENNIDDICENMFNIFEEIISTENQSVNQIKKLMKEYGAKNAMMSGSGPSVFGIFNDRKAADTICSKLIESGSESKVCIPINKC